MITQDQLNAFLVAAQAKVNADYAAYDQGRGGHGPVLQLEIGKRYARIIANSRNQRMAFGFVDMTTGNVLKSAGWKAPAKNFIRGNINDPDGGCGRIRWTGVH